MRTRTCLLGFLVLAAAIAIPVPTVAQELVYEFPLKKSRWEYWEEGGARGILKSADSKLTLNIQTSPAGAFHHIQLYMLEMKLQEGQKYMLKLVASSNVDSEISCKFHKPSPNWISYQSPDYVLFELAPGDNTKEEEFVANRSTDQARITCYFGQNRGDTTVVISKLQLYKMKSGDNPSGTGNK